MLSSTTFINLPYPGCIITDMRSPARVVIPISLLATAVICFIWWMNGAELEDAWLYAFSIIIVLLPAVDAYFKSKGQ